MINYDDIMIIFWFKNIATFPVNRVYEITITNLVLSLREGRIHWLCFSGLVKSTRFISQGGLNPLVFYIRVGLIHWLCFSGWIELTSSVSQGGLN